jgi:hypothetical protein
VEKVKTAGRRLKTFSTVVGNLVENFAHSACNAKKKAKNVSVIL